MCTYVFLFFVIWPMNDDNKMIAKTILCLACDNERKGNNKDKDNYKKCPGQERKVDKMKNNNEQRSVDS